MCNRHRAEQALMRKGECVGLYDAGVSFKMRKGECVGLYDAGVSFNASAV